MAMLTFLVCLLPVVSMASMSEYTFIENSKNYILNVSNYRTLWDVRFIGDPDPVLNLSKTYLSTLSETALNNVRDVETLDLSNNFLGVIYSYTFSNLIKLKRLLLAHNEIRLTLNAFGGLKNLQLLDLSYNSLALFRRGTLFGVANCTRILVNNMLHNKIIFTMDMYKENELNNSYTNYMVARKVLKRRNVVKNMEPYQSNENNTNTSELGKISDMQSENKIKKTFDKNTEAKFCIFNGIVRLFDILGNRELAEGICFKADLNISRNDLPVNLINYDIMGFQKFWYQAFSLPISSFRFLADGIIEIEEVTLNDLPASVTEVYFDFNRIRKIRSNVIKNDHLRMLSFSNNSIEAIEDNAFAKTRLQELYLDANRLESLNFVFTLPDTIINLNVSRNRVNSIPNDAFSRFPNMSVLDLQGNKIKILPNNVFSRLPHLTYLSLEENQIETLPNNVFQNLTSLEMLLLGNNSMTTIELAVFKGLTALTLLKLAGNSISRLHINVFVELTALKSLDLSRNKFIKVPAIQLPPTLDTLYLEYNQISTLVKYSFIDFPRRKLYLNGNPISSIERGAFYLPTLIDLHIEKTNLTTIEGDSYEGLDGLINLYLSENKISEVHKGSCKNFKSLEIMVLTSNPLQNLESGAFYGFTAILTEIYFEKNNLKEIQAGLFEDI